MPVYKYACIYVDVSIRVYISSLQFNMWMNSCMMQVWHVSIVMLQLRKWNYLLFWKKYIGRFSDIYDGFQGCQCCYILIYLSRFNFTRLEKSVVCQTYILGICFVLFFPPFFINNTGGFVFPQMKWPVEAQNGRYRIYCKHKLYAKNILLSIYCKHQLWRITLSTRSDLTDHQDLLYVLFFLLIYPCQKSSVYISLDWNQICLESKLILAKAVKVVLNLSCLLITWNILVQAIWQ